MGELSAIDAFPLESTFPADCEHNCVVLGHPVPEAQLCKPWCNAFVSPARAGVAPSCGPLPGKSSSQLPPFDERGDSADPPNWRTSAGGIRGRVRTRAWRILRNGARYPLQRNRQVRGSLRQTLATLLRGPLRGDPNG